MWDVIINYKVSSGQQKHKLFFPFYIMQLSRAQKYGTMKVSNQYKWHCNDDSYSVPLFNVFALFDAMQTFIAQRTAAEY